MYIRRDRLDAPFPAGTFLWAAGIEDTFITAPSPKTGRTLDEYELTGHYERWREDIDLFAQLGLKIVRYGVPWHRINPARDVWDFSWCDGPIRRLVELGIEPIIDLVHYGLPRWIAGAYCHPEFDTYMAEYCSRVVERYHGAVRSYTPLNEPRITAWYCGKLGWWPPALRGWSGFLTVLLAVCRGIVASVRAMKRIDPEIVHVHVDATDLYDAASAELEEEAARRQEIVFLALDLVSGQVHRGHALYDWIVRHRASPLELEWFQENAIELDMIGINLYPLFSEKRLQRTSSGLRVRMRYASASIVERLADLYWHRYGRPLLISETASEGSVRKRLAWLNDSVQAVSHVRRRGIPLIGYTWWPLFALVTWGYREGKRPPHQYLKQMGLWDLEPRGDELVRVRTPLVDRYREFVASGAHAVGELGNQETRERQLHVP